MLLVTLGSLAGLFGGFLILLNKKIANILSVHAIPFAAGVMLAVAFLDLLPEALEHLEASQSAPIMLWVLITAFFFEKLLIHLHQHDKRQNQLSTTTNLVVAGDTIHNFIDGVVIATAFLVRPELGFLVALATFFHEVPQEMGDFVVMLSAGWSRKRVLWINIFTALSAYLGAISVFLFSKSFQDNLGIPLSIAAGIFLYIGATDLLPELQYHNKGKALNQAILLLLGIGLIIFISQVVPQ